MKKLLLILVLSFSFPCFTHGQEAQYSEKFSDRLFFGGSFGLQFGSYTYIDVSPLVGYRITDRLSAGLGVTYIYYKVKDAVYNIYYSTNVYGGSIFSRFLVTNELFLHAELEMLSLEVYDIYQGDVGRQTVPSLLLGGGYRMPMGSSSSVSILVLFEVLEDPWSPYHTNPVVSIGFGFGF